MSCEDIPSLLDLQKAKLNADDFGRLMGTGTGTSANGVTGQVRPTYNAVMANLGYTRVGTFASGATLLNGRQTLLWDIADGGDGQEYGWSGSFLLTGKVVPPNSTPLTTGGISVGAWISRFDPELKVQVREALRRSYAEAGYNLVDGSFEAGGTLVNANDVLLQESTGKAFSGPAGAVDAETNPVSSGFIDVSGESLRIGLGSVEVVSTGAVTPRVLSDRFSDIVNVKDFGAVGDGTTDDTVAIQNAVNSLSPRGGMLYFPAGYYLISNNIAISNIPIAIRGDGMMSSQIIQITSGKNGFTFTSTTPSNAPVGGGLLVNTFQIEDISINRGAGTGGSAIGLTWAAMTSNTPQFIARNLRVYSKADAANAWAHAISGFNMNGLRMSTCQLHGNPLQGANAGAEPFTMKAAIRLINTTSDTTGLISFFMDKVTALYCNIGLEINGWHEGFQLNEIEFVQVGRGIVSNGSSAHQNPDMLITNSHIDAREADIDLNNVFKLRVANCDFIKNDATLNGACIRGVASGYASIVGTSFTCIGTQTATNRAIDCDLNCFNWTVTGCHFLYFKDGAINNQSSGWIVTSNQFDDSPTAIAVFGALGRNVIANNTYRNVANPVIVSGSTNSLIAPITFATTYNFTVTVAGSQQGFNVPIPAGIFSTAPDLVLVTRVGGTTPLVIAAAYNNGSSTATSLKVELTASGSLATGTYTFAILAMQKLA